MPMETIVIALGGNALLRRDEAAEAAVQRQHIATAADAIARVAEKFNVLVTHGNGPQVGLLALQAAAYKEIPPYPLDILGAESEGMIGYMIEQMLSARLPGRQVATLLTLVEVDPDDTAFQHPTKPIGPFYEKLAAEQLTKQYGWTLADIGDTVRRVVPSPEPKAILEINTLRLMMSANVVTICAGGGGIPVTIDSAGGITGVEAVVDKDRTAALLARDLDAGKLMILTDVDAVYSDWETPHARAIRRATPDKLLEHEFASGSMGPKVEAACDFVSSCGRPAVIGLLENALDLINGVAGTEIIPGSGLLEWWS